jgi:putative peptide zinc metalloprotease protein
MSDPLAFPRLRPDIRITPFSSGTREKTFLLRCPDGRSLEISGKTHELLDFLDGNHDCAQIAQHLSGVWQTPIREEEVHTWLKRHLLPQDLLLVNGAPGIDQTTPQSGKQGLRGVPLFSAHTLLPFSEVFRFLFQPFLALPVLWASALCHILLYARLFTRSGPPPSVTPELCAIGILALLLSVLFHELGHLSACRYFRCPHGEVRFGLYLIFPVLYANVTPAWQLPRKARVVVDLGGVYFQLLLTPPLFLLHRHTQEPLWLFLFLELDGMILFALNPFLRFDGYWVCSDLLGVANLRSRSHRLARLLLKRLAGRHAPAPHPFLTLRRPEAVGLILYTVGSYVFTLLIFLVLVRFLPQQLAALPGQLREALTLLTGGAHEGSSGTLSVLFSLLFPLVLLFAALRMSWRVLHVLLEALKKAFKAKRSFGRQHPGR